MNICGTCRCVDQVVLDQSGSLQATCVGSTEVCLTNANMPSDHTGVASRIQQQGMPVATTAAAAAHAAVMLPLDGIIPTAGLAAHLPPPKRHKVMGLSLAPSSHDEDVALLKEVEDLFDIDEPQYLAAATDAHLPQARGIAGAAADAVEVVPQPGVVAEAPAAVAVQEQQAVAGQRAAAMGQGLNDLAAPRHMQLAAADGDAAALVEAAAAGIEIAAGPLQAPPAQLENNEAADDAAAIDQDDIVEDMAMDAAAGDDMASSDGDVSDTDSDGDSAMSISSDGSEPDDPHEVDEDFVIDLVSSEEGSSELESSDDLMLLSTGSDDYDLE